MKLVKVRKGLEIHWMDSADPGVSLCFQRVPREKLTGLLAMVPVSCDACERAKVVARFAFCENVTASTVSPIHIRMLTGQGLLPSGGADTMALCGLHVAWDIPGVVNDATVLDFRTCRTCRNTWNQTRQLAG